MANAGGQDWQQLSRRGFLRLSSAGVLVGAIGLPLLNACAPVPSTPSAPTATTRPASGTGPLPTYSPLSTPGFKPEYRSPNPRVVDGYDHYPRNPFQSWTKDAPGTGSRVDVAVVSYFGAPTPFEQNPTWQEINKRLNANVQMNMVPGSDYRTRMATLQAGNELPDIIHIYFGLSRAPNLVDFIKARCADLTPYLGGDAIKDYPNLANIPTYAWKNSNSVIDGKIYQWPIHRHLPGSSTTGGYFFKNTDLYDREIGADTVPRDAEDFKKIAQQLNRPQQNVWAVGNSAGVPSPLGLVGYAAMFGAPNLWGRDGSGKLVRDRETEQYKAAVGFVRDLWAAGLVWPNAPTSANSRDNFAAGRFALSVEGYGNSWVDFWRPGLQQNPPNHFAMMKPFPGVAGAKPQVYLVGGWASTNVLKQAAPERIKELLRIADWLAAPFGSQEDLLLSYGLAGQDYTLNANGDPEVTSVGNSNASFVPWQYVSHRPYVNYIADVPGFAQAAMGAEEIIIDTGVEDVTNGYYSRTNFAGAGSSADQAFFDGVIDVIFGRRQFSDYDQLVMDWQNAAGNKIRDEFKEAMGG